MTGDRDPRRPDPSPTGSRAGRLRRMLPHRRQEPDTVYQITEARRGVRDDVDGRTRRYLISMGIRTVCFIGAVVASGWIRWTLVAAALVLPYLSVVFANGGRERIEEGSAAFHDEHVRSIRGRER